MADKPPSFRPVFTPERLPAVRTPVTPMDVGVALIGAWGELLGDTPFILDSIYVLMAQWALETGRGKACWNYNLGNAKSVEGDNRCFTYYECNEILPSSAARKHEASAKPRTDATGPNAHITKDDGTNATIWFYPDHPYARFRAFRTLEDGALDYLALLYKRFPKAWPAVCQGDPIAFCSALKAQRYFTADLEPYSKGVQSLFREYRKVPLAMPQKPEPEPEGLSEEERDRTLALLWKTSTELTSKLLEEERILHGQREDEERNDRDKKSTLGWPMTMTETSPSKLQEEIETLKTKVKRLTMDRDLERSRIDSLKIAVQGLLDGDWAHDGACPHQACTDLESPLWGSDKPKDYCCKSRRNDHDCAFPEGDPCRCRVSCLSEIKSFFAMSRFFENDSDKSKA